MPDYEKGDMKRSLRFIDLFAGLGGFHLALKELGHHCVFACEVNDGLAALYEKNFGLRPFGDIRDLDIPSLPEHDILCAGFPCQPFSKAGDQQGLECPQWGDLIDYVVRILRIHKPRYFIIENVPNLVKHRQGKTWRTIRHRLRLAGYSVQDKLLSPHDLGVPQIRRRAFIVGCRGGLNGFSWPDFPEVARSSLCFYDITDVPAIRDSLPAGVSDVHFRSDLSHVTAASIADLIAQDSSCFGLLPKPSNAVFRPGRTAGDVWGP